MKRAGLFCLSFAILFLSAGLRAANVQFSFVGATNYPGVLMPVKLSPTNVPIVWQGSLVQRDPLYFMADTNGNLTVSNMAPVQWIVQVGGGTSSVMVTTFYITVPNTNATINFTNIVSAPTNLPSSILSAYSQAASDARYVQQNNSIATGLSSTNQTNFGGITLASGAFKGNGSSITNLTSASGAALADFGLIPPGAVYSNDTVNGLVDYQLPVVAGQGYYAIVTNAVSFVGDASDSIVDISAPGGAFVAPAGTPIYAINFSASPGQPVLEQVYLFSTLQNLAVSNGFVASLVASNLQVINPFGGTFNGTMIGADNPTSGNATPAIPTYNLPLNTNTPGIMLKVLGERNNTYFPQHDILARMMPVPWMCYSTYLDFSDPGTVITASAMTNVINMLEANGMAAAGITNIEIDAGWEMTNVLRMPFGPQLFAWTNNWPVGITGVVTYAHSQAIPIALTFYTYYSQTSCVSGATYGGAVMGSPPGYLFGDIQDLVFKGVDGINVDSCGVPTTEAGQRQMYLETINAVESIAAGFVLNQPNPRNFVTRMANVAAGKQQFPWVPYECNIVFDGSAVNELQMNSAVTNWYNVLSNSWCIRPGHYYNIDNIPYHANTNVVVYQMSMMAILPQADLFSDTNAANLVYYTNQLWRSVYQDPAVLPGSIVQNNATDQIWYRPMGSINGNVKAVVFLNTNSTSQTVTLNTTNIGIAANTAFDVFSIWNNQDLGVFVNIFSATVAATNAPLYTFTIQPSGEQLLSSTANGAMVTNLNGIAWYVTNNTPTFPAQNGSICTVTDGRQYYRSNNAWNLH